MKTITFEYDDEAVCGSCGSQDTLHYNYIIRAGRTYLEPDSQCYSYCDNCCALDGKLTTSEEYLENMTDAYECEMLDGKHCARIDGEVFFCDSNFSPTSLEIVDDDTGGTEGFSGTSSECLAYYQDIVSRMEVLFNKEDEEAALKQVV